MTESRFEQTRPEDYLLRLATSELGRSYKSLALAELEVRPGDTVLDLGCGPGADLLAFADAAGPTGRVIGIDKDPALVEQAVRRTENRPTVEIRTGDIHVLDLPDDSVDRAHTDRVLQHVADPGAVLREIRRVLRPGGRIVLAEPDWDTLIVDYPDLEIPRAYTRFVADKAVRNACVGRALAGLAVGAGFTVSGVVPITTVFRDVESADKALGLQRVTGRAVDAGYLTSESAARWLTYLAEQPFFASATLYLLIATAEKS